MMVDAITKRSAGDFPSFRLFDKYELSARGLVVHGRPTFAEHLGAGEYIMRAHQASGFWIADWLRYGERRAEWAEKLSQAVSFTGLSEKRLMNIRSVGAIPLARRRNVEFAIHEEVAPLTEIEQEEWLDRAETEGLTVRELRLEIRASRRRKVIEGQAFLDGMFRVILADPPWLYRDRPPSGVGVAEHMPGMTYEEMMALPVAKHALPDSVLFCWVTAPLLYERPGPNDVIRAWGFTPKTQRIWDKGAGYGHYYITQHEILIVATRGACTPDHPTPMKPSVVRERAEARHSRKPASFRQDIMAQWDGPYLELFATEQTPGWACYGNDAALWGSGTVTT